MKGLKAAAITAAVLLVLAIGFVYWCFQTAQVKVVQVNVTGTSAAQSAEDFAALRDSVNDQTFLGTLFSKPDPWNDAAGYVYLTFETTLQNNCMLPIERVEVQVVPKAADVLQVGDYAAYTLPAGEEDTFRTVVLSDSASDSVREMTVTYYVWGHPFRIKTGSGM